jgi:hypothetical protein
MEVNPKTPAVGSPEWVVKAVEEPLVSAKYARYARACPSSRYIIWGIVSVYHALYDVARNIDNES